MSMVLEMYSINLLFVKINFAFLATAVIGMLFGPTVGFFAGLACDVTLGRRGVAVVDTQLQVAGRPSELAWCYLHTIKLIAQFDLNGKCAVAGAFVGDLLPISSPSQRPVARIHECFIFIRRLDVGQIRAVRHRLCLGTIGQKYLNRDLGYCPRGICLHMDRLGLIRRSSSVNRDRCQARCCKRCRDEHLARRARH